MSAAQVHPLIHPTAVIAPGAQIGEGTSVGPYTVIGPKVKIGRDNRIGPHVVIEGNTIIGDGNTVFQFSSVGAMPQDLKYHGEESVLEIGDRNIIREFVTLQPGTEGGGMITKIGSGNLFMANCHIGHDSTVGDKNILANSVAVAGHVRIDSGVTIGGLAAVHQFVRLGDLSFIGGGAMVIKDVPPFTYAQGDRAGLVGINRIGLERRGFQSEEISRLRKAYRRVFLGTGKLTDRVQAARTELGSSKLVDQFLDSIAESPRGVTLPRNKGESDEG